MADKMPEKKKYSAPDAAGATEHERQRLAEAIAKQQMEKAAQMASLDTALGADDKKRQANLDRLADEIEAQRRKKLIAMAE